MTNAVTILVITASLVVVSHAVTIVKEVSLGDVAELHCPSNDDNHRFQFWQLQRENIVIGPTNKYNRDKYKYEVLTGKLLINGVSSNENGFYTCVCKHILDNSFYSETIELVVKRDWDEVYETDPYTNLFRITLIAATLLILGAFAAYVYTIWQGRPAKFRVLADEESADEAGPSYKRPASDDRQASSLDTHELDTELPKATIFTDIRLRDSAI